MGGALGKIVGFLFVAVMMVFVCLSYMKFVMGLATKKIISKTADKFVPDHTIPEFSFLDITSCPDQKSGQLNSCHWREVSN